jgi:hypothetical protein
MNNCTVRNWETHYYNITLETPLADNAVLDVNLTWSKDGMSLSCAHGKCLGENAFCVECARVLCYVAGQHIHSHAADFT